MIYAIAKPGEPARIIIETDDPASAHLQCREDETCTEIDAVPAPVIATNHRADRNARLAETDWTQLPDTSLSEEERAAWASYRQALRDLDLIYPAWPTPPM